MTDLTPAALAQALTDRINADTHGTVDSETGWVSAPMAEVLAALQPELAELDAWRKAWYAVDVYLAQVRTTMPTLYEFCARTLDDYRKIARHVFTKAGLTPPD